jgi:hypothetical protein
LDEVIERNVYRGAPPAEEAQRFVRDGLLGLRARLAATPADALITGDWPA